MNFTSVVDEFADERPTKFIKEDDLTMKKDGGVVKKIISEGFVETKPVPSQEVTVEYIARLEDGTVFDQTKKE